MADVSLDVFIPQVSPFAPGCPEEVAKEAILNACIKFCEESWILREDIPAGNIVAGIDDYTISPQVGREVVSVISFLYNEVELARKTEEELDREDYGWRTADPGTPTAIIQLEPGRVRLNRIPSESVIGGLIPRVVTKPTEDASTVDERLFNDWKKAIRYGALEEIQSIPNKMWTDIKLADRNGRLFSNEIQKAKARANMSYFKRSTTAQMRPWI